MNPPKTSLQDGPSHGAPELERASRRGFMHQYVTDEQMDQTVAGAIRGDNSQEATAGLRRMDQEQAQHRGPSDGQPHGEGSIDIS